MKKNKLFIAGLVTVFVALCSLTLVSSTWAKYTSTATGSDSARVAEWKWTYNGNAIDLSSQNPSVSFDLFTTIKDTAGANEADVAANLIAPGTSGSFKLTFANASEVNAKLALAFTSVETVEQIQYSIDDSTWVENISDLSVSEQPVNMNAEYSITIYWKWLFENNVDSTDTADGIAGNVEHSVTVTATFEQVD